MKNILKSLVVFGLLLIAFDFIFFKLRPALGGSRWYNIGETVVFFIVLFLLFLSIVYKKAFTFKSSPIRITVILALVFFLSFQIAGRLVAMNKSYYIAKSETSEISPGIWKFDKQLAYVANPGAVGYYQYYIGDTITGKVPVYFDAGGHRTVPDSLKLRSDSSDLFLGCSWTFGDFVNAQNTYPYLTAKGLGHSYVNVGTSGYGMAQMYILANRLIPENHFKYVFIQLSPWLVDRAIDLVGPTSFGYWPYPYFSKDKDGQFNINYPAFRILGTNDHEWRNSKMSYGDKWRFWATLGISTDVTDYYSYNFARLKASAGIIPKPTGDKENLQVYFYNSVVDVCKAHGTTPVIIKFGYNYPDDVRSYPVVQALKGKVLILDLDSATHTLAKGYTEQQYDRLYKVWHVTPKGDSLLANGHPGVNAHQVYANTIIDALKK